MTLPVAPPAVVVARRVLLEHLTGVDHIASQAPKDPWPARFIRVDRIGGRKDYSIDQALILVECWARQEPQAAADANLAYAAFEYTRDDAVCGWEGGGIVHYDDPDRGDYFRYQFTGTLSLRIN